MNDDIQTMIDEARKWIGTPFVHQGRTKGQACDCLGLVIAVAKAAGYSDVNFDVTGRYGQTVIPKNMAAGMSKYMDKLPVEDAKPGDWYWIAYDGRDPTHLAMLTERGTIIHARPSKGLKSNRVAEQRFNDQLVSRARCVWRMKEKI